MGFSKKIVQKGQLKKFVLVLVAEQKKLLGKKDAAASERLIFHEMVQLARRDKKQHARQNIVLAVVNDLGAVPFLKPKDFVKGMLVRVLDVEFAHFLKPRDLKIAWLVRSVHKMPDVVMRENILHPAKVGIF